MLLALALGQSPTAHAQPTLAHASEEQQEQARTEYELGRRAYDSGEHARALAHFESSYAAVSSPNSQLMIGRCLVRLRRPAEAYRAFDDAALMAEAWGNKRYAEAAASARKEMAALKPDIAMLMLEIDDPSGRGELRVDGQQVPRNRWTRPYASDPGDVTVVLSAPDGEQARQELALEPGVAATVELKLDAPPATEPRPTPSLEPRLAPEAHPPASRSPPPQDHGLRTVGLVTGGVGIAALAAFGVLGALANGRFGDLENACPSHSGCDPALRDKADEGERLQTAANISLVAGGLLLSAGATMVVLTLDDEQTELSIGGAGLQLRGPL